MEVSELEIRTQSGPSDIPADAHKHSHANAHADPHALPDSNSQTDLNLTTLFEATFSDLHGMSVCI